MQIEELSHEDQAQVYRVCRNGGLTPDDPMVLILIEWQRLKNQVVDIARGKKEGLEHLVSELRENSLSIGETVLVQKSIAQVLNKQLEFTRWFRFRFLTLFAGVSFVIGIAVGMGTLTLINTISVKSDNKTSHKRI